MSFFSNSNSIRSATRLFTDSVETSLNYTKRWATKKSAGTTKNGRDSKPKYLGLKKFGGHFVEPGNIIVRQRGTKFHPGNGVGIGKDHTIFATVPGIVHFSVSTVNANGFSAKPRKYVSVLNFEDNFVFDGEENSLNTETTEQTQQQEKL